ncbi:MAG: MFS transporter [Candidatus Obscuribacterales bacterium]|nr:MFS transporter [Candidatus Obscuribacterales bacterium]
MTTTFRAGPTKEMPGALRVFSNPRYCLYFAGQLISQSGTWMQMLASSWLAYKLTGNAFLLAAVGLSSQLPSLLTMPIAGVLVDRFDRHRVVLITQIFAMLQAAVLAALVLTNQLQIWHLIALGVWSGVISGFDMPSRSAFVVGLVENRADLPAAIAMNSTLMNATRMIGPALAGFVVSTMGEGFCFLLNALSYIAVILAMLAIRGDFSPSKQGSGSIKAELMDGLQYVWNTVPLRALISLLAFFGLGGMAYALLLPVFVKQIGGDANTLGYLMSASAVGSLLGALLLARRRGVVGLGKWISWSSFGFAAGLIVFSLIASFWAAALVLAFMGFNMMVQLAAANTILQSLVHDDKRGRVMSLFSMAFMGTAPIGSLICGALSNRYGFNITILGCGIYCLLISIIWAIYLPRLRLTIRPLYAERGLMGADESCRKPD